MDIEASVESYEYNENLETLEEKSKTESRIVDEETSEESTALWENKKTLDDESEVQSEELERISCERTAIEHPVADLDEDIQQEDNLTPVACAVSDFHEEFEKAEQVVESKKNENAQEIKGNECVINRKRDQSVEESRKKRYVSSSSSSCDEDKVGDTRTITETPESSGGRGHLTSDGEESLESSPEPQTSSLPHYLAPNNSKSHLLAKYNSCNNVCHFIAYIQSLYDVIK